MVGNIGNLAMGKTSEETTGGAKENETSDSQAEKPSKPEESGLNVMTKNHLLILTVFPTSKFQNYNIFL